MKCDCHKCCYLRLKGYSPRHGKCGLEEEPNPEPVCGHERVQEDQYYKVLPYHWQHHDKGGKIYQIVLCKTMARANSEQDANDLVAQLNRAKKLEREVSRLQNTVEQLNSQTLSTETVRQAMIKEVAGLAHCRWSSHRKQIVDFGKAVMRRISAEGYNVHRSDID